MLGRQNNRRAGWTRRGRAHAEESGAVGQVEQGKCPLNWWQKLGVLGFCFFLVKGLLWLLIPAGLLLWRTMSGE